MERESDRHREDKTVTQPRGDSRGKKEAGADDEDVAFEARGFGEASADSGQGLKLGAAAHKHSHERTHAFTTPASEGRLSCFAPSGEAGKASDR